MNAEAVKQVIEAEQFSDDQLLDLACAALSRLSANAGHDLDEQTVEALDEATAGQIGAFAVRSFLDETSTGQLVHQISTRGSRDTGDAAHMLMLKYRHDEGAAALEALLDAVRRDAKSLELNGLRPSASA